MLGRLLHTAANSLNPSNYTRNSPLLESATEEEHTRSLLFPDASLLHQPNNQFYPLHNGLTSPTTPAGGFDDRGGIELDAFRDLRVLIAQDALGDQDDPNILLDSKNPHGHLAPQSPASPPTSRHKRGSSSTHTSPTSPLLPRFGQLSPNGSAGNAFDRSRFRSQTLPLAQEEPIYSPRTGEVKDETKALLNCMFGTAAPHSKSATTKMHIVTTEYPGGTTASPVTNQEGSASARKDARRRAPLSRAHTYSSQPVASHQSHVRSGSGSDPLGGKDAILLTRMFSVNLPEVVESASDDANGLESISRVPSPAYPFPDIPSNEHSGPQKRKKLKEKKTPAYAVSILVQLPTVTPTASRPPSRRSQSIRRPSDSAATSFGSEIQNSWTILESPPQSFGGVKTQAETIEHYVEIIVDRWDTVTRSLSHLEEQASKEILGKLKDIDARQQLALLPKPPKEKSMQRTNQRIIQLPTFALSDLQSLQNLATHTLSRLAQVVNIPRVLCGQNRWGPFLDEARWVTRWFGGKEHNFFFFNLLTAFLGNHTDWLAFLRPEWHKHRFVTQQKANRSAEAMISNRTVLVCPSKMAARRMIFLLSSFFPSNYLHEAFGSPLRPGTSFSTRCSSAHSPTFDQGSFSKQQSLRRSMNKRATESKLASRSFDRPQLSTSTSSNEFEHLEIANLRRTGSDTKSIKPENLPISANDASTRKSSAATTSTVTPNPTTPIAHFAPISAHNGDYFPQNGAVDTNGSAASANLLRNLERTGSGVENEGYAGASKWSLLSGVTFWSGRQDSSSIVSDLATSQWSHDTRQSGPNSHNREQEQRSPSKLSQMVSEVSRSDDMDSTSTAKSLPIKGNKRRSVQKLPNDVDGKETSPYVSMVEDSPLKLMVDEREGVVDVDIGLPGFFASEHDVHPKGRLDQSPDMTSLSLDGLASSHSLASTTNLSSGCGESGCINVAGWLKRYHEDFVLQSVWPYSEMEAEIKASMSAEPTPSHALPASSPRESPPAQQWVDVCSTIIADARTYTIKRLRLKRRISLKDLQTNESVIARPLSSASIPAIAAQTNVTSPAFETVEEIFTTESIMDLDPTLIDAVEKVLAQGSHRPSRTGSPSRSHHRSTSNASANSANLVKDVMPPTLVFPPSECRKVIVNALEDVVRSVQDDLSKHELGRDIQLNHFNGTAQTLKEFVISKKPEDNALREGVRKWLISVQTVEGA